MTRTVFLPINTGQKYHHDRLFWAKRHKTRRGGPKTARRRIDFGGNFAQNDFTGKELDGETGLYYYGARYLDPRTSRWISGDPALGEYLPGAPVNDEARKQNGNLPGGGGIFNLVNLHVYHYAGNNPIKYVDPDGREDRIGVDLNLYSPDEPLHYPNVQTVPHPENTFIVGGHGNTYRMSDDRNLSIEFDSRTNRYSSTGVSKLLSAQDLAGMITEPGSGYKNGDAIILISCEVGKDTGIETVPNFAQDLADILGPGTIVKAPDGNVSVLEAGKVYLFDDGKMLVTDENYSHFKTFIGGELNDGN